MTGFILACRPYSDHLEPGESPQPLLTLLRETGTMPDRFQWVLVSGLARSAPPYSWGLWRVRVDLSEIGLFGIPGVWMHEISTIIVNYNTAGLLVGCLNSIASQSDLSSEVIVVDNASEDDSVALVTNDFPWVRLIVNDHNVGFARANNRALDISKGKYAYFLNPDTVVRPGAFEAMAGFMTTRTDVGLAGTRIINPDGSPQSSVEKRYPGQKRSKKDLEGLKGDTAWVLGASMIARTGILEDLGGFDENFLLYGEEQDLCLRIRKAGWKIDFISNAVVVHWGGQSERNTPTIDVWKKKFAAELLFYKKHYSRGSIRRIHRANVVQALWRILSLRLTLPLCADKETSLEKLDRYRLALKTFHFWKFS